MNSTGILDSGSWPAAALARPNGWEVGSWLGAQRIRPFPSLGGDRRFHLMALWDVRTNLVSQPD
jgi:hypothetical protein